MLVGQIFTSGANPADQVYRQAIFGNLLAFFDAFANAADFIIKNEFFIARDHIGFENAGRVQYKIDAGKGCRQLAHHGL